MQETTLEGHRHSWKAEMRLIRARNVLMIIVIQVLAFFVFAQPAWPYESLKGYFFLVRVVCMTSLAAISGYYINDLMDREADRLNGRTNMLNTGEVSEKYVRRNYIIAILFGAFFPVIGLAEWSFYFLLVYFGSIGVLWLYSKYLKRLPLIGNIAISAFCAGVVLIIWWPIHPVKEMPWEMFVLMVFAFVITLIREIVKDMEDVDGDREVGDRTLPVAAGTTVTKSIVATLLIACIAGLLLPHVRVSYREPIAFIFWIITIALLIYIGYYLILKAKDKAQYHFVSTLTKVAMLTGTLFIVL